MKICSRCGEPKDVSQFWSTRKGLFGSCKACESERRKKQRADNPNLNRGWQLKHRYGIDLVEWTALFLSQGERCAACGDREPGGKGQWHTDHDHGSGVVRSILCSACNLTLGASLEDPARLRALALYLEDHLGGA